MLIIEKHLEKAMQGLSRYTDIILFSNNNLALGERLRDYFRKINIDVMYCNTIRLLVSKIRSGRHTIILLDKAFKKYANIIKELLAADIDLLANVRFIFIDNDFGYYINNIDNEKYFCIPETNLESAIYSTIITCEMLNCRQQTLTPFLNKLGEVVSEMLLKMGFSYKLIGFRYIKQCIEQAARNNFKLGSLHKEVYPYVALQNVTNAFNIERGIRTAIKDASKTSKFKDEFKNNSEGITNRLFLEYLLDKVNTYRNKLNN